MLDNYDLWEMNERRAEAQRRRLPKCIRCGNPITSEKAYYMDGWMCQECFDDYV